MRLPERQLMINKNTHVYIALKWNTDREWKESFGIFQWTVLVYEMLRIKILGFLPIFRAAMNFVNICEKDCALWDHVASKFCRIVL